MIHPIDNYAPKLVLEFQDVVLYFLSKPILEILVELLKNAQVICRERTLVII